MKESTRRPGLGLIMSLVAILAFCAIGWDAIESIRQGLPLRERIIAYIAVLLFAGLIGRIHTVTFVMACIIGLIWHNGGLPASLDENYHVEQSMTVSTSGRPKAIPVQMAKLRIPKGSLLPEGVGLLTYADMQSQTRTSTRRTRK